MKPHEAQWIEYAWSVVACGSDHVRRCTAAGGLGVLDEEAVRFPGFVGPDFEPGRGVLCLAHVHRYLPEVDDISGGRFRAFSDAIVGWKKRGRSDESDAVFLAESRPAYMASAKEWPWWKKHYGRLLDEGRVPISEVAFTNFAKCRTVTEEESNASLRLAKLCAEEYPPADLVRMLRPAALLIASLQLEVGDVGDVPVIRWNGRNSVDSEGYRLEQWLPRQGGRLRKIRSEFDRGKGA